MSTNTTYGCKILQVHPQSIHAIQEATASEPLTLAQEYAMQQSWQNDADKLTFIICHPLPLERDHQKPPPRIPPEKYDNDEKMIGDVNLFLSITELDPELDPDGDGGSITNPSNIHTTPSHSPALTKVKGEIELMIPSPTQQRRGYGRAALLTFIRYIRVHQDAILASFLASSSSSTSSEKTAPTNLTLSAKISSTNTASLRLFESLGFEKTSAEPSFFGEFELLLPCSGVARVGGDGAPVPKGLETMEESRARREAVGYVELGYGDADS